MAIDVGMPAVDDTFAGGNGVTYVFLDNPANADGLITSVDVHMHAAGNVTVAIFALVSANVMYCRSAAFLGQCALGLTTHALQGLAVKAGDFIGAYVGTGQMHGHNGGGVGHHYKNGDQTTPGTYFDTQIVSGYYWSCYGSGSGGVPPGPTGDSCEDIAAWLDAIEATYVPCVDNWLAAQG